MKPAKTILVTGIGGNVAQGILDNISFLGYPITLIGTDIAQVTSGHHLCDAAYQVPYAMDPGYMKAMTTIIDRHQVDLILPATDKEGYVLSKHQPVLPPVFGGDPAVTGMCLDKYQTAMNFKVRGLPFAETMVPSSFRGQFDDFIVKPRQGAGSSNIYINPDSLAQFPDDTYVLQKWYFGQETTTAFYVDRSRTLTGWITFCRELKNGYTHLCWVVDTWQDEFEALIKKMITAFNLRGSYNIQAIVNEAGQIVPFEINARISGTNSIRAQFGFNDVKMAIDEWCYGLPPEPPVVTKGVALRILKDVIYPDLDHPHEIYARDLAQPMT